MRNFTVCILTRRQFSVDFPIRALDHLAALRIAQHLVADEMAANPSLDIMTVYVSEQFKVVGEFNAHRANPR